MVDNKILSVFAQKEEACDKMGPQQRQKCRAKFLTAPKEDHQTLKALGRRAVGRQAGRPDFAFRGWARDPSF